MRLVLGVADAPYNNGSGKTTGDVAERLERRYKIMGRFAYANEKFIAEQLGQALAAGFETMAGTGQVPVNVFEQATIEIANRFRLFLDLRELDAAGDPGIPTQASLRGVSHRKARPYAKSNPPRPSFIDSGHYQNYMKAWVEK